MAERSQVKESLPLPYPTIQGFNEGLEQLKNVSASRKIDRELLQRGAVAPGNESKIITAFYALGLIEKDGMLTELGRRVRSSGGDDVVALGEAVDSLYHDLFEAIPGNARTEARIRNFFKVSRGVSEVVARRAAVFFIEVCRKTNRPLTLGEDDKPARRETAARSPRTASSNGISNRAKETTRSTKTRVVNSTPHLAHDGDRTSFPPVQIVLQVTPEVVSMGERQLQTFFKAVFAALNREDELESQEQVGMEEGE